MINDTKKIINYLNLSVNSIFKILPLYEEKNIGVSTYIDSLLFELYGLDNAISIDGSGEYISLLSTLESIKLEVIKEDGTKKVVKREVFKCINLIKNMIDKIEEGA